MINENEIRAKLIGLNDLDQFEDWLVAASWDMHKDSSIEAQKLVASIELALAEFQNGHISEPELRQRLKSLAATYKVSFGSPFSVSESVEYTSNSSAQRLPVALPTAMVCVS